MHLIEKYKYFSLTHQYTFGAFNVPALAQGDQQAALPLMLDSLNMDVCFVSECRQNTQLRTTILRLILNAIFYYLRTSHDQRSHEAGYTVVGIALSTRAETALVEWIPVNRRLFALRLLTSTSIRNPQRRQRCISVSFADGPKACSYDLMKGAFQRDLDMFIGTAKCSDLVILASVMNAEVERIDHSGN